MGQLVGRPETPKINPTKKLQKTEKTRRNHMVSAGRCLSLTKKMRAIFGEVRDLYANLDNVAFLCQRLKI